MPRGVMIDDLHVEVYVPRNLSDQRSAVIRRTLRGARFSTALRAAVIAVVKGQPQLAGVRVTISR